MKNFIFGLIVVLVWFLSLYLSELVLEKIK